MPRLQEPGDAIVSVALSSICASDLHIRNGAVPRARPGVILGHEFVGEVVETSPAVKKSSGGTGLPVNVETFCGSCFFCKNNFINNCEQGGWQLGCRIDGCQTEYVRVPFADNGLNILPSSLAYQDALFVGDVLSSGYFGAELAAVRPGDTVVVLGAGPVGLAAMLCARLFGPARIVAVDLLASRLQLALAQGFADTTVNAAQEDVEQRVRELTRGRGADAVIEAAGGADTFQTAWKIARPNACVAVLAMYEKEQILPLPQMYGKNLTFRTGGVDAVHCERLLRLIEQGKINTGPLITHTFPLNRILDAYTIFEHHSEDCVKCAITPFER